jgi:hypothetical protein
MVEVRRLFDPSDFDAEGKEKLAEIEKKTKGTGIKLGAQ